MEKRKWQSLKTFTLTKVKGISNAKRQMRNTSPAFFKMQWQSFQERIGEVKVMGELKNRFPVPLRGYRIIRTMMTEGCYEIETAFSYKNDRATAEVFTFSTLIQPDADIINLLPDYKKHWGDAAFREAYTSFQKIHFKKLQDFVSIFQSTSNSWDRVLDTMLIGAHLLPPSYALLTNLSAESGMVSTGVSAISWWLSKEYLKPTASQLFYNTARWGLSYFMNKQRKKKHQPTLLRQHRQ
ncbi:hypothetical protein V6R21_10360 [Limibacter armeniacum]|uniref:hypothetical protein n=1 Tax=Limibacter armeniacum TaxID=466084 RepID=UPI002FE64654